MKQPDMKELQELLRRKELAASQSMSNLQPGDEIYLSLSAYDEAKLKRLLQQALEEESALTVLMEQAKTAFFSEIEKRRAELLALSEEYALSKIHDELGVTLDTALDEQREGFTQLLLNVCQERPDLFTVQPDAIFCVIENEDYGYITAQHCAYHNLYDLLKGRLEFDFVLWHQEHRQYE